MDIKKFSEPLYRPQTALQLWVRVALWCAVIFAFSAAPNYSGRQANFETLHGILDFLARKAAHLLEFALLMRFAYPAVEKSWVRIPRFHFWLAFGFCILYSISDEWHQTHVFGRTGTVFDIFVDAVGSVLGFVSLGRSIKDDKCAA